MGRLLPREIRDRVFEPAFSDLLHSWLTEPDDRRTPFGMRVVATLVGCVPIAARHLLVRAGRLTRLGRVTVWGTAIGASVVLLLLTVIRPYLDYGN